MIILYRHFFGHLVFRTYQEGLAVWIEQQIHKTFYDWLNHYFGIK